MNPLTKLIINHLETNGYNIDPQHPRPDFIRIIKNNHYITTIAVDPKTATIILPNYPTTRLPVSHPNFLQTITDWLNTTPIDPLDHLQRLV